MFLKKNRADKKAVEKIFKKGLFIASKNINLKYILEKSTTPPRVSFIVPKAVEKKAVKRNYLRRHGYVELKKYFENIPDGFIGAFIFKKNTPTIEIENDIKKILNKIN